MHLDNGKHLSKNRGSPFFHRLRLTKNLQSVIEYLSRRVFHDIAFHFTWILILITETQ